MIKRGQLHNFPWNVYVDGCGTLTGWNGKNSLTARTGWGPGDAAATARLGRRWAVLLQQETAPPVSASAPSSRGFGAQGWWRPASAGCGSPTIMESRKIEHCCVFYTAGSLAGMGQCKANENLMP